MLVDMTKEQLTVTPKTLLNELNTAYNHGRSDERAEILQYIFDTWTHPTHVEMSWLIEKISEGAHEQRSGK